MPGALPWLTVWPRKGRSHDRFDGCGYFHSLCAGNYCGSYLCLNHDQHGITMGKPHAMKHMSRKARKRLERRGHAAKTRQSGFDLAEEANRTVRGIEKGAYCRDRKTDKVSTIQQTVMGRGRKAKSVTFMEATETRRFLGDGKSIKVHKRTYVTRPKYSEK